MRHDAIPLRQGLFHAVALKFDADTDEVPSLLLKGRGEQAEEIVRCARDAGVHIEEVPPLAAALMRLGEGDPVPPSLYLAVAEVIVYVMDLEEMEEARAFQP